MYLPFQGAKVIPVTFDAGTYTFGDVTLPQVDIVAARATDGQVWLALTNVDPHRSASVTANIAGMTATTATGEVLTAARVDSVNTFDNKTSVVPAPYRVATQGGNLVLELAPKSVTVVKLQ
jgi:alpha-N-arabinofuranosidase